MVNAAHNFLHPSSIALDKLGRHVLILSIGEQPINLLNAISVGVLQNTLLHGAKALSIIDNGLHSIVAQSVVILSLGLIKNIVFHFLIILLGSIIFSVVFGLFFLVAIFKRLADHGIHDGLLFIGQSIEHIGDRFIVVRLLFGIFSVFFLFRIGFTFGVTHEFTLILIRMIKLNAFTGIDHTLFIITIIMLDHGLNVSTRIRTGKNQAHFTNRAMNHVITLLLKLVCENRKSRNIAMLNKLLGVTALLSIVKGTIGVNALFSIL